MEGIICQRVSVFANALTRGKYYSLVQSDEARCLVRVKGDNGRIRWFPAYCFTKDHKSVPILTSYSVEDEITPDQDIAIEVTVTLSTGERRWCWFVTPASLAVSGDRIEGTQVRVHYCNRHVIVATEVSVALIGRILKCIDSQGDLIECTLPVEPPDDATEAGD